MPTVLNTSKIKGVFAAELEPVSAAISAATSVTVKSKLIPILLRMDARLSKGSKTIDCKEGCSYCCYYHVSITAMEALALADHIRGMEITRRTELSQRVTERAKQVALLSREEYVHTNIACAFLESGRCSVYEVRPAACRGFHSCDVAGCKRDYEDPSSTAPNDCDAAREEVNVAYKNVLLAAQHRQGCDATSYEMHGAVAEALTNPAAFKRWKSAKVAFPSVRDRLSIEQMSDGAIRR